jgi:hypothetical protein
MVTTSVMPSFWRLNHKDQEFKASLGYKTIPLSRKNSWNIFAMESYRDHVENGTSK